MNRHLVIILCKNHSDKVISLENTLADNNIDYTTICDLLSLELDNHLFNIGFYNLTRSPYIKKPSAWDKAFYHISINNLTSVYDHFFFIEDDVYSIKYEYLVKFLDDCINYYREYELITKEIRPQSHHPNWKYWNENYISNLKYPSQSFNPLCRLSKKIVNIIFEYQKYHKKFEFHEIIVPSLCLENNLSYLNYIQDDRLKQYIGRIRYNPILLFEEIKDNFIYHPVKLTRNEREKGLSLS